MANRPNSYLNWTDGNSSKVVQPPANVLLQGWSAGQAPPFQYANWQMWLADQWIQYLDQLTNTGIPDQALRLINGGYWSFAVSTGILSWSATANIAVPGAPDSSNAIAAGNITLSDGEIAYVAANIPIVANGSTTSGSPLLTNMNFTGNLSVGMNVVGPGIPSSTTVLSITTNGVTLSNNATATATAQTFVFSNASALTVSAALGATYIPDLTHLVIARRVGSEVYVGVNAAQITLLDGEFKPLGQTGYLQTYQVLAGQNLTAGQAVYISVGGVTDGGRTTGSAYPMDCSSGNSQRSAFFGFVTTSVSSGQQAQIVFSGFYAGSSLTPGHIYYGDPSIPGGIVSSKPSASGVSIVPVGLAVNSTTLLLTNAEGLPGAAQNQSLFQDDVLGSGNGSQTAFTLSQTPYDQNSTFLYLDGIIVPKSQWTLVGTTATFLTAPARGQLVEAQYILASSTTLAAGQETPTGAINGVNTTFTLAGVPINQQATMVFVDGIKIDPNSFSLVLGLGFAQIILTTPPSPGQTVYVTYFENVGSGGGGGGGISGASNLGSGVGLFSSDLAGILQFLSLKAGTNVTLTPDGLGSLVIAAAGGGGGSYTRAVYGTPASPETFLSSSGLNPGLEMDQTWILQTSGGQQTVSSALQIANGTVIGQRLTLRGVDAVNYFTFQGSAGTIYNNLSLNGNCNIDDNQALVLEWDGDVWYEVTRRA